MTSHVPPAERCSQQWLRDDLPAWGTASRADFWVALEQPGPWGNKALTQSHLDPELGTHLENLCAEAGGRPVLVRRFGRHVDTGSGPFSLFVAGGLAAGTPWLGHTRLQSSYDVVELLSLGDDLARGPLPGWLSPAEPILAVCTNAKRDQCCALEGRDLLTHLAADDRAWEVSHIGGHRFAPTALVLPTGQSLARLTPELARAALEAADAGRPLAVGALHDRGLGHLPNHLQVVDAWARAQQVVLPEGIEPEPAGDDSWLVGLQGVTLRLAKDAGPDELSSSCGAGAVPVVRWSVSEVTHG